MSRLFLVFSDGFRYSACCFAVMGSLFTKTLCDDDFDNEKVCSVVLKCLPTTLQPVQKCRCDTLVSFVMTLIIKKVCS